MFRKIGIVAMLSAYVLLAASVAVVIKYDVLGFWIQAVSVLLLVFGALFALDSKCISSSAGH